MPVPAGSAGDRLLESLGYHVRWTQLGARSCPRARASRERPLPEGYVVREADRGRARGVLDGPGGRVPRVVGARARHLRGVGRPRPRAGPASSRGTCGWSPTRRARSSRWRWSSNDRSAPTSPGSPPARTSAAAGSPRRCSSTRSPWPAEHGATRSELSTDSRTGALGALREGRHEGHLGLGQPGERAVSRRSGADRRDDRRHRRSPRRAREAEPGRRVDRRQPAQVGAVEGPVDRGHGAEVGGAVPLPSAAGPPSRGCARRAARPARRDRSRRTRPGSRRWLAARGAAPGRDRCAVRPPGPATARGTGASSRRVATSPSRTSSKEYVDATKLGHVAASARAAPGGRTPARPSRRRRRRTATRPTGRRPRAHRWSCRPRRSRRGTGINGWALRRPSGR